MLPRPTFSIRKLIPSPGKKQDASEDYEGSYFLHDDDDDMDTLTKIRTWRPPPINLKKRSKPSLDVRRSQDLHCIMGIPPLPDTPQSSTTSLSSIDNGSGYAVKAMSPRSSPPRRPDRSPMATSPSPQRSPQRSPLLQPQTHLEDHQQSRGRGPISPHYLQPTPPASPPQHISMMPEALITPSETAPGTPETTTNSQPSSPDTVTITPPVDSPPAESVSAAPSQQNLLVPGTDSTAPPLPPHPSVSQAKLSDSELAKFPKPKDRSPVSPPVRRKSTQRRSQGSVKSAKSPTKASSPLSPPARSGSRTKRTKSKKARRRPRVVPARQSSMWQLTESAKDLFTIRIFHRIEVDEMLPESTLREIRMSRAAHWTRSPELGVTHVDGGKAPAKATQSTPPAAAEPIEPLSLDNGNEATSEDVTTPRASVVNRDPPSPDREDTKTPTAQDSQPKGETQTPRVPNQESVSLPLQLPDSPTNKSCDGDDGETFPIVLVVEDQQAAAQQPPAIAAAKLTASPITPPLKSPMHRRNPSRQLPPLPTIPEIITTAPDEPAGSADNSRKNTTSSGNVKAENAKLNLFSFPESDEYIYLASNPYTLTMPTFRHGPIRLAKEDLPINKLAATVDDTLDWTAFQMAILGGAGDFFSESTDYSRPSEAELDELEELTNWFASLGFKGPGALVGPGSSPNGDLLPRTPVQSCWTPAFPRTPGLTPPSPTSTTPGSSNSGSSLSTNTRARSSGFRRIDPPSTGFYPTATTGSAPEGFARHRRSVSSIAFGQPLVPVKQPPQYQFNPPCQQYQQAQPQQPQQQVPTITTTTTPSPSAVDTTSTTTTTTTTRTRNMNHANLSINAVAASSLPATSTTTTATSNNPNPPKTTTASRPRSPSTSSVQSLPQSPMMDLVVSHDVEGNEYMVPMGFNLSHDLGDFLTWSAEYVQGGFGGGDGV
ncbi:hypothetical protein VTJ49DRAFT_6885 [Mycothermus thermophilus]|uniref:Uncharacterized protein n=1 Tax=Humicola insolens TaxID=85995 RepID=A0ABR3VI56_HUMIN